jgi:hypothetical protein
VNHLRQRSLRVDGGTVRTTSGASQLESLTIAGAPDAWTARLELADTAMVVSQSGISSGTIQNLLKNGYAGGSWNGTGLTSSSAAAIAANAASAHLTALGFADAATLGITSVEDLVISEPSFLVKYTLSGDANLDGMVNALDFNALASHFGASDGNWMLGDFNYDGSITSSDFTALSSNFNAPLPADSLATLVPEPAAIGFLACGGLLRRLARR